MTEQLFEWNDTYLIGVEELDFEHRDLLARLNELHLDILRGDSSEVIEACLAEVCIRVAAHFALEESYMKRTGFPHYDQHKKQHDAFLEEVYAVAELFREGLDISYQETLETRLENWVTHHILTSDKEL